MVLTVLSLSAGLDGRLCIAPFCHLEKNISGEKTDGRAERWKPLAFTMNSGWPLIYLEIYHLWISSMNGNTFHCSGLSLSWLLAESILSDTWVLLTGQPYGLGAGVCVLWVLRESSTQDMVLEKENTKLVLKYIAFLSDLQWLRDIPSYGQSSPTASWYVALYEELWTFLCYLPG